MAQDGKNGEKKPAETNVCFFFIKTIKSYPSFITVSVEEKKYAVIKIGVLYGDEY